MTTTDTTRLADIRRALHGEGDPVLLWRSDVEWLLAQLDAANATIARLTQADDQAAAAIAEIERHNADLTGQLIAMKAERDAWRERAEKAETKAKHLRELVDTNNEIMRMNLGEQ